jgi:hypothetical protein
MADILSAEFMSLLNEADRKKIMLLTFIRENRNGLTIDQVETKWEENGERPLTRTGKNGKRTTDNTVRTQINSLVKKGFVTITKIRGKNYYTFTEQAQDLKGRLIDTENISDLLRWAITFRKYQGLPFMDLLVNIFDLTFEDLLEHYEIELSEIEPYIDFETSDKVYSGWTNNSSTNEITEEVTRQLTYFYNVISITRETVEFTYRSFQTGLVETVSAVEPHLLKEHNKRWYLIGFDPQVNAMRPFSLDRIIQITERYSGAKEYALRKDFDSKHHWSDSIGIYVHPEGLVSEVSFELKNGPRYNNINYLISLPMHHTQKAIIVDETWTRFEYKIHLGPEVVRHIRQWGLDNLRNIHPKELDFDVRCG